MDKSERILDTNVQNHEEIGSCRIGNNTQLLKYFQRIFIYQASLRVTFHEYPGNYS